MKYIRCIFALFLFFSVYSQDVKNWHLKDQQLDGRPGISLKQAQDLVDQQKLQATPVTIALITGGVNTTDPQIAAHLWVNSNEIPSNGKDDDGNGYVDDVHGWNFLGNSSGELVLNDSKELHRTYQFLKQKEKSGYFSDREGNIQKQAEFDLFNTCKEIIFGSTNDTPVNLLPYKLMYQNLSSCDTALQHALNKEVFTGNELEKFTPPDERLKKAKSTLLDMLKANQLMEGTNRDIVQSMSLYVTQLEAREKALKNATNPYRGMITKDDESNLNDRAYGNNLLNAGNCILGSIQAHLISSVCQHSKLMILRVIPDEGEEHDKDLALAIRYAVDQGARVIYIACQKEVSPAKNWVDEAVLYAATKEVLIVHAISEQGSDADEFKRDFPNKQLATNKQSSGNWISVAGSAASNQQAILYEESSFGKNATDLLAPAKDISVSYQDKQTGKQLEAEMSSNTFAAALTAGVAGMLLGYKPKLSVQRLIQAIETGGNMLEPNVAARCKTGMVLNAHGALKQALSIK